jgi:hypothetical protein
VSNQPAPTQPLVAGAAKTEELDRFTDDEIQEALEYAKKLRAKKE